MSNYNYGLAIVFVVFFMALGLNLFSAKYHEMEQTDAWNDNLQLVTEVKIYSNGEVNTFTDYNSISRNSKEWFYLEYDNRTIKFRGAASIEDGSLLVMELYSYHVEWK